RPHSKRLLAGLGVVSLNLTASRFSCHLLDTISWGMIKITMMLMMMLMLMMDAGLTLESQHQPNVLSLSTHHHHRGCRLKKFLTTSKTLAALVSIKLPFATTSRPANLALFALALLLRQTSNEG